MVYTLKFHDKLWSQGSVSQEFSSKDTTFFSSEISETFKKGCVFEWGSFSRVTLQKISFIEGLV